MLDLLTDPNVAQHTLASISRVILSVVIATALGTILAVLPRYVPSLHALVHERIKPFLNSFPSVGWAVLLTIWMDMSAASVVMTQVMILTPFCLINIAEGVRALDEELSEMGESFTRSPLRRLFRIDLPALVPFMLASVRMTYGVCWKIALLAELFGAQSGLGYLMQIAQDNADPALLFATCFMVVALFRLGEFLILDPLSRRYSWNDPEQVKSYV
jgi:NitT/TauT family transport system permease protein/sulfonate transport system permease protein